jgi:hypothetical protein
MPEHMPEDMPVAKCINVMVGITRSKVFFYGRVYHFDFAGNYHERIKVNQSKNASAESCVVIAKNWMFYHHFPSTFDIFYDELSLMFMSSIAIWRYHDQTMVGYGWIWLGFGSNLVVRNLGLAQKIQRDSKVTQLLLKVVPVIEMPCSMHEAIHVVEGNSVPTQCAIISLNVHIVNFERCSLALLGVFKYI